MTVLLQWRQLTSRQRNFLDCIIQPDDLLFAVTKFLC